MPRLTELQETLAEVHAAREAASAQARALAIRVEELTVRRAEALRVLDAQAAAALDREIAESDRAAGERRVEARRLADVFAGHALEVLDIGIEDRIGQLDDHVPVLLFPVRLETKFRREAGRTELRVRIFPDEVLISAHDPLLTANEHEAGGRYWAAREQAAGLAPDDRRRAEAAAWKTLATGSGGPRARYVARKTRPGAPEDEPLRPPNTSVPPRARLLPDQFVVMALDQQGTTVAQQTGRLVPETLVLGPDPGAPVAELLRDPSGRLTADPKLAWLFDYERAVEAGMAVTLPVPAPFDQIGFHRIVAIGVKASLSPDAGAAAVEELFGEHRFTKGIDIVRQGAATNNTEGVSSAFTTDLSADEALVAQEVEGLAPAAVLDHAGKSDAQRLSEALGVSFGAIKDWPSAVEAFDVAEALAMNRALWPATFGTYLRSLVGGRLSEAEKTAIERFFLTYVTGRSLLPAIRVGAQPYGILAASNLMAWQEPASSSPPDDIGIVVKGTQWFRNHFEAIARKSDPALAQLGTGPDSVATSLRVIGQLASSTAFAARKAVTDEWAWNTLTFEGLATNARALWWNERERIRNENFAALGLDRTGLPLADLFFFDAGDPLDVPVVDLDPEAPLSETEPLTAFDGTNNYIQWLLTASDDQLRREAFVDARGEPIGPPKALLYRLLQMAWTTRLTASSHDLVARIRPDLVAGQASTAIVNVRGADVMTDDYATRFDAQRLGLLGASRGLGDLLLDFAQGSASGEPPPEALPVMSHRDALIRLADRPTAVLERLFAEHLDLGSYRLDAWLTGLVSRRLDHMRRRDGRARGLYLGAFGYVEGLVASAPAAPVDLQMLPESLRETQPVLERPGNGGFVHAPSLNQAVTAAVLRNAYLTHAEPDHREVMSVNLTSRRVREAMSMIEGIRAGQDLAALLGYQLERGLHERHTGVELDEFIYVLRGRFPLVSRRLTPVPADTPAEVVEARNVVDGYDLIEHVRRNAVYPHGIDGLPASGPKADAIRAEFERLEETLDAIADLMLAESVHQAVQSNVDRVRGVIGAIADGEMPPVPDVVLTPRSGRVLTERVALYLPNAATGWLATPSPRARANPRLNGWLARQLPRPETIGFEVHVPGTGTVTMTLDRMDLEAIDVVSMTGDRTGDGSSELECYLADRARAGHDVADEIPTRFGPVTSSSQPQLVVDVLAASGATPLGRLWSHLRSLRSLVTSARGLHAQDLRLVSDETKADRSNPKGYRLTQEGDLAELPERVQRAVAARETAADALEHALAGTPSAETLRARLRAVVLHGLGEALPRSSAGNAESAVRVLTEQARSVLSLLRAGLQRAASALAPLPAVPVLDDPQEEQRRRAARLERRWTNLLDAAREALGAGFPLQPIFTLEAGARAELEARLAQPIESDPLAIETWLQRLTRVRPRMANVALASTAALWNTGQEPRAVPVQLPLRAGDPWIGSSWTTPPAEGEVLSVMTLDAPSSLAGDLEGLLIDEWTETVPTTKETTGLTFHFDRPNAVAPQALLLAVPPTADGRWQWSELVAVVLDTFAQARLRAVEPDLVTASPLFQILPTAVMPFTYGDDRRAPLLVRDLVRTIG